MPCCACHAAGAAAKAESLEGSVASAKDQLLRLSADFENFRKRTVRRNCSRGWGLSRHNASSARKGQGQQLLSGWHGCKRVQCHHQAYAAAVQEQRMSALWQQGWCCQHSRLAGLLGFWVMLRVRATLHWATAGRCRRHPGLQVAAASMVLRTVLPSSTRYVKAMFVRLEMCGTPCE